jgi:hypothetical protein
MINLQRFWDSVNLVIRALFGWSGFNRKELSEEYGITLASICNIINGKTWNNIRITF